MLVKGAGDGEYRRRGRGFKWKGLETKEAGEGGGGEEETRGIEDRRPSQGEVERECPGWIEDGREREWLGDGEQGGKGGGGEEGRRGREGRKAPPRGGPTALVGEKKGGEVTEEKGEERRGGRGRRGGTGGKARREGGDVQASLGH